MNGLNGRESAKLRLVGILRLTMRITEVWNFAAPFTVKHFPGFEFFLSAINLSQCPLTQTVGRKKEALKHVPGARPG